MSRSREPGAEVQDHASAALAELLNRRYVSLLAAEEPAKKRGKAKAAKKAEKKKSSKRDVSDEKTDEMADLAAENLTASLTGGREIASGAEVLVALMREIILCIDIKLRPYCIC